MTLWTNVAQNGRRNFVAVPMVTYIAPGVVPSAPRAAVGLYRNGTWYLDKNSNGNFDGCSTGACISWGGVPEDRPVPGKW